MARLGADVVPEGALDVLELTVFASIDRLLIFVGIAAVAVFLSAVLHAPFAIPRHSALTPELRVFLAEVSLALFAIRWLVHCGSVL